MALEAALSSSFCAERLNTTAKERIDKIILQKQEAIDSFSVNPKKSINLMTQVITDLEYDVNNYEVLIEMYFRTNDYKNVVTLYNKLNELELTNLNATIIEFISISYLNLNENVIGCNLAQTLNSYGYRLSASLALACSIAQ